MDREDAPPASADSPDGDPKDAIAAFASAGSAPVSEALLRTLARASGNIDEDIPTLLKVIADRLDFEIATFWWWRPEDGLLHCEHTWARGSNEERFTEAARGTTLRPGEPIPGQVFVDGEPAWIPDATAYPNFRRAPAASAAGLRSGFAFPIFARGEIIAVIELFTAAERAMDQPLFEAVTTAAAQLGDFIERWNLETQRTRLLEDLDTARRRQQFLLDANRALSTTRGLEETIDRLASVAVPAIGDLCLVDIVDERGLIVRLTAHHADPTRQTLVDELRRFPPDPNGEHPAARVIRTGESFVSAAMSPEFLTSTTRSGRHYELTRQLGFTSYVAVPLRSDGRALGALTVVSAGSGRHFGSEELALVEELASQVASVIERERRYDEQHRVAQFLQRSMLPEELLTPAGLEVCARYITSSNATEAGGDFYDVVSLGPSSVALVIGDVEGHDLTAIATMAKIRSAVLAFLQTSRQPHEVLGLLDRFVARHAKPRFATVALGLLDVASGSFDLASAGHPPPLIVDGRATAVPCVPGPPVGVGRGGYQVTHVSVRPGAGLVFYTDGLVEHRVLGPEARLGRLREALERVDATDLEAASDKVLAETLSDVTPSDDVAFLWAIRRAHTRP